MSKKLETGPQIGAPPSLEWIAVERLKVDEVYQRVTDTPSGRRIIQSMIKEWDWALCQPLVVSRREDGEFYVLDGQHRKEGAVVRGDIPHLPCVVVSNRDRVGEAATYVLLNTKRQHLSQTDLFNGMLAANDPDAKSVQTMLEETGWRVCRSTNTASFSAGQLVCAPMLAKACKMGGPAPVRNALTALREAYPDTAVRNASTMLRALIGLYRASRLDGEDPDLFIETIGNHPSSDWELFGIHYRQKNPTCSRIEAISEAMFEAYKANMDQAQAA